MRFEIQNIGKMHYANIDLIGITIIAGYNNTGKSTIGKSLISILNAYHGMSKKIELQRYISIRRSISDFISEATNSPFSSVFNDEGITSLAQKLLKNVKMELTLDVVMKELRELDDDEKEYVRKNFEKLYLSVERYRNLDDEGYVSFIVGNQLRRDFNQQINSFDCEEPAKIIIHDSTDIKIVIEDNVVKYCSKISLLEEQPIYIEPRNILDDMGDERKRGNENSILRFLKDEATFSDDTVSLAESDRLKETQEMSKKLVEDITHGVLKTRENQVFFYDKDFAHDVNVKNIASGIKSMAIILRLLENGHLKPNGILVIDEPEVNLHPQWQIEFADFLVALNQKLNIQILLNTHSPFFLRAIEVATKKNNTSDNLKLYMTKEYDGKFYVTEDVTSAPELIYRQLYMPLEFL